MPFSWLQKTLISAGINSCASLAVYAIKKADSSRPHVNADLYRCIDLFKQGMQRLLNSFGRISCEDNSDTCTATNVDSTRHALTYENGELDILAVLDRLCDVFTAEVHLNGQAAKFVSMEGFVWAKTSFRAAQAAATKAIQNEALHINNRILAVKVRIFSVIFGCLDEPERGATACMIYLKNLNSRALISDEIGKMIGSENKNKPPLLILVVFINYIVFRFTESLARNILNVHNWPRLGDSVFFGPPSLHPIRSVGLRALTMGTEDSKYGINPKSISFSDGIDATNMVVNSAGDFVVVGLDESENAVVHVYTDTGQFKFAVSPTEGELNGVEFQPSAIFTDKNDDIYVQTKAHRATDDEGPMFVFNKEGRFRRVVSIHGGFMALEKKTGKIFISNKNGVSVYKNSGEFLRCFKAPEALCGSSSPIATCEENTIIQTDIHDQNVYLLKETGKRIRKFQVKQARGWKYIAFNSVSSELIVSYLSEDLKSFQLDAFLKNGQHLVTMKLPEYSSHPRSVTVTANGRIAVLYKDTVYLI
mgnify:FL=1